MTKSEKTSLIKKIGIPSFPTYLHFILNNAASSSTSGTLLNENGSEEITNN